MLRKSSRASTSKEVIMAEYNSLQFPTTRPSSSSFFNSPRLFTGFNSKGLTDTESMMSPTSILDTKPFTVKTPFWSDNQNNSLSPKTPTSVTKTHWDKLDSRGVGLGLVDVLTDEGSDPKVSKPESRMVLFGSQLKIKIPPLPPSVSPKSPGDFGTKTRNSQLSPFGSANTILENTNSPRVYSGYLSATDMELSEDYTCVISHGPNPKTTHIFEDCIVESCCGVGFAGSRKGNGFFTNQTMSYPSESFLSFCHGCKKSLGQGRDIYMYRGEKAFCSGECRYKEIMQEEAMEKSERDDDLYSACS